jgi:hypothetical protein
LAKLNSKRAADDSKPLPAVLQLCHFLRFYGENVYRSPVWATPDNVIPFKVYALFANAMWSVMAGERLSTMRAVAMAQSGEKGMAVVRREIRHMLGESDGQ